MSKGLDVISAAHSTGGPSTSRGPGGLFSSGAENPLASNVIILTTWR